MTKGEAAAYGALCLIWSSTWLAIRIGVRYLPPIGFAGFRFLIGTILLGALLLAKPPGRHTKPMPWVSIFAAGFLQFVVSYGLVFWGEQVVTAGFAALSFASGPLFVALFARVLLDESLTLSKIFGISLGFSGIFFLFFDQFISGGANVMAEAGLVLGAVASALANVLVQRDQSHVSKRLNATLQMAIGCFFLFAISYVFERHSSYQWNLAAVTSLLFLSIFGSAIAFVLYYWLLHRQTAMTASTIAFVAPLLTIIEGHQFLGEALGWNHLLGGMLVVAGSGLVVRAGGHTSHSDEEE